MLPYVEEYCLSISVLRVCGLGEPGHDLLPQQSLANTVHDPRVQDSTLQVVWLLRHVVFIQCVDATLLFSWKFDGDIGEGIKSIPYQLQRLFIHLQVTLYWC